MMKIKTIGSFEIFLLIVGAIAFSYFMGIPFTSASQFFPTGCCMSTKDGAICQEMLMTDQALCADQLVGTDCSQVDECRRGCCFNPEEGLCSLNAPKKTCTDNGGTWEDDVTCSIPQCKIGCCVLGEEASAVTSRECTKLARENNFEKDFREMDSSGACLAYVGLSQKGACLSPTDDYSGLNNCVFTTKGNCNGEFVQNYLCTAEELDTVCERTQYTTCVDGRDEVYFVDSCGNTANIYDASKINDEQYWTNPVSKSVSCQGANATCGNCYYLSGTRCYGYREGKDTKAEYGDYVCRDLDCENGRRHGESWCIYDLSNRGIGQAPVGSRHFKGICMDGEITIEPCADFNQQICEENTGTIFGESFTEAGCVINDWRSCIQANNADYYSQVKQECDNHDQCVMFLDLPANQKYKNMSLPGFNENLPNNLQGAARDAGEELNPVLPHCVPKYTPGMQFWTSEQGDTLPGLSNSQSSMSYGGSTGETEMICSLGDFTCIGTEKKACLTCDFKPDKNQVCFDEDNPDRQIFLEALNERCKMLGPCGSKSNIVGELGMDDGFYIYGKRFDPDGETEDKTNSFRTLYTLSSEYLNSLKSRPGITELGSLSSLTAAAVRNIGVTGYSALVEAAAPDVEREISERTQEIATDAQLQSAVNQLLYSLVPKIAGIGAGAISAGAAIIPGTYTSGTITAGQLSWSPTPANPATVVEVSDGVFQITGPATEGSGQLSAQAGKEAFSAGKEGAGRVVGEATGKEGAKGGGGLKSAGLSIAAAVAAYMIVQAIGEANGWTPGETAAWASIASSAAAFLVTAWQLAGASASTGPWGWVAAIIILIVSVLYAIFSYQSEYRYYVFAFQCVEWEAPKGGDCDLCNTDIRPCSEYRCKSIGSNCEYYAPNGEPGYCRNGNDISSATIRPWKEAITTGHKYTQISDRGFRIERNDSEELDSWSTLVFGIETSETASCRIENNHTAAYANMRYNMITTEEKYHKIAISAYVNTSTDTTLAMEQEAENEFYIRCQDLAGNENRAEFAVEFKVGGGPDLSPPAINRFIPEQGSYLAKGTNETSITMFVNEPSECRYSAGVDENWENMPYKMSCVTHPSLGILGEWACTTDLENLTVGVNNFFFKCKDQIGLEARASEMRNLNPLSKEYNLEVCSIGLSIDEASPNNTIFSGSSPVVVELKARTSGCVDNGVSTCSYRNKNDSLYSEFFYSDALTHKQEFNMMVEGKYDIEIRCEDEAGNFDETEISFNVEIDDDPPRVINAYDLQNQLVIVTDEEADCYYTNDDVLGCNFDIWDIENNASMMLGNNIEHKAPWLLGEEYFIKCVDVYNNTNTGCGIIVMAY